MSVRTAATKLPRTALASNRGVVQGQSVPAAKRYASGPGTGAPSGRSEVPTNWPLIAGGAVVATIGAVYWTTRSSKEHGDKIAHDAQRKRIGEKIGEPGQPGHPDSAGPKDVDDSIKRELAADAPKTAYQTEAVNASKGPAVQGDDLVQSIERSLKTDAPKTAYKAEEEVAKKRA
ncbi:hypothetical protein CPB86DRAFT_790464 [Serendipita vermifera]|nr:hypothetical protein CPB86DRAFT_790464 [Serendipita vermifera]